MTTHKFWRETKRIYKVQAKDKNHALQILEEEEDRLEEEEFKDRYLEFEEECISDWHYMGFLGFDGLEGGDNEVLTITKIDNPNNNKGETSETNSKSS